jgi:DNA-binding MarR family transcriptional regulator
MPLADRDPDRASWTFVTSHTLVLICIASDPEMRVSEIADHVGLTERRVQGIISDLVEAGYLTRTRNGRRNRYEIDRAKPLRHIETEHRQLGELLALLDADL